MSTCEAAIVIWAKISFYAKESVHPARFCKKGHDAKEAENGCQCGTGGLWNGWAGVGCGMGGLWSGWAVERVGWGTGGLGGNYLVKSSVSSLQ